MNKKRILITGASGYLGRAAAIRFRDDGYEVVLLGRANPQVAGTEFVNWSLNEPKIPDGLNGDSLIHFAWNMKTSSESQNDSENVNGTLSLFDSARHLGLDKIVFISTTSAFPGTKSVYGKSKLKIEEWARGKSILIVRPGLVVGGEGKGMIGALTKIIQKLPLVPVFGANKIFYVTEITMLSNALVRLIEDSSFYDEANPVIADPTPCTFISILKGIVAQTNRKVLLMPVPWPLVYGGLRFLEIFKIKLPFKSDSLLSLMSMPAKQPINVKSV